MILFSKNIYLPPIKKKELNVYLNIYKFLIFKKDIYLKEFIITPFIYKFYLIITIYFVNNILLKFTYI